MPGQGVADGNERRHWRRPVAVVPPQKVWVTMRDEDRSERRRPGHNVAIRLVTSRRMTGRIEALIHVRRPIRYRHAASAALDFGGLMAEVRVCRGSCVLAHAHHGAPGSEGALTRYCGASSPTSPSIDSRIKSAWPV